jgi:hypothetical protein
MQDQANIKTSPGMGRLSLRDLAQGAIMAGLGAGAGLLYPLIMSWSSGAETAFNLSLVWKASVGAAGLHLIRKLFSGPALIIKEPPQGIMEAVKQGEVTVEVKPTEESTSVNQKSSI